VTLSQTILLSLTVVFLVIGVHQSVLHGFAGSYWIFMLMLTTLIIYQMRKNKDINKETPANNKKGKKKATKKNGSMPRK
jgi:hypothetical protein